MGQAMIERKYILIPKSHAAMTIVFTFDLNGLLNSFKLDGNYTEEQWRYVTGHMPVREADIEKYRKIDKFLIKEVPTDLSFVAFWNAYGYKVGKKGEAENIWRGMKEPERVKALVYIRKYDEHLRTSGAAKAYPTSYLRGRYFDN